MDIIHKNLRFISNSIEHVKRGARLIFYLWRSSFVVVVVVVVVVRCGPNATSSHGNIVFLVGFVIITNRPPTTHKCAVFNETSRDFG